MNDYLEAFGSWITQAMPWVVVGCFGVALLLELALKGFGHAPPDNGRRFLVNFGLIACSALLGLIVPFSNIIAATWAQDIGFGLLNMVSMPWWAVLAPTLIIRTLTQYWYHRASHRWSLLWRLHRIHHSDTHIDLSLALREHPLDLIPSLLVHGASTIIFGLPVWAVALVDLLLILGHYWQHIDGKMHPRLAKALGGIFATPEIHRIHHSAWERQTNSNYGNLLIIWDRIFGSFVEPAEGEPHRIGLGDLDDRMAGSLLAQLMLPLRNPRETEIDLPEQRPYAGVRNDR
jgi:sterol desaturase/sphingolipid hydroxylase (fatty acid hydroxylase superfamily)